MKYPGFEQTAMHLINKYGFEVFPLRGKMPAIPEKLGGHGCLDATKDPDVVKQWAKQYPKANVGIATGSLVVVDVDRAEALSELSLPETLTVKTGRTGTGLHFYYWTKNTEIGNRANWPVKGVDIRGKGGYVVGVGSVHPETKQVYEIFNDSDIALLPTDLEELFLKKPDLKVLPYSFDRPSDPRVYMDVALRAICQEIAACPEGGRNHLLNAKAFRLGRFVEGGLISREDVYTSLLHAAISSGLGESESIKTIESGIEKGIDAQRNPGQAIKMPKMDRKKKFAAKPSSAEPEVAVEVEEEPGPIAPSELDIDYVLSCARNGSMGNAALFAAMNQGKKLFDHMADRWMTYEYGYWQRDMTKQTQMEMYDQLREAYATAFAKEDADRIRLRKLVESATGESDEPSKESKELSRKIRVTKDLDKMMKKLGEPSTIANALSFSESLMPVITTDFDADPFLLNLANGTYDLKENLFRPHNPNDLIAKRSQVHYVEDAICPRWTLFLLQICCQDWEMVCYLQKMAGLFLSGRTDYQYLFILYGTGSNGKSTFMTVISEILSDFYVSIPIDTVLSRNNNSNQDYNVARLKGARVAVASEIPKDRRLNESLVKDLVSTDLITARSIYQDPFQFRPTHKLVLFGNHLPKISNGDHGIWRRIRSVPFEHSFSEEELRPAEEVLHEFSLESSGILNWMIEGYNKLIVEGMPVPERVRAATEAYRMDSDDLQSFLADWTIVTEDRTRLTHLYEAYKQWCTENDSKPSIEGTKKFAANLREKGFLVKKMTGNYVFVSNLTLKTEEERGDNS